MNTAEKKGLADLVADLQEDRAIELARHLLDTGKDPFYVLQQSQKGLFEVGERYEKQQYFISALIMGGEIMSQISDLVQPLIPDRVTGNESGRILLGTIQGDIHHIGKDLFKVMARCHGFQIEDLGVDVPPESFLRAADESPPDIVGLSCLVGAGVARLQETISLFHNRNGSAADRPKIVIGGTVDGMISEHAGADFWTQDAMEGVRICQRILKSTVG